MAKLLSEGLLVAARPVAAYGQAGDSETGLCRSGACRAESAPTAAALRRPPPRGGGETLGAARRLFLSSKCGFATLLDPRGGRSALADLGALMSIPTPWPGQAFAKKRSVRYKVNGSSAMTDASMVRVSQRC